MPSNPGTYNTKLYKGEEFAMDFRLLINDVSIAFDSETQAVVFRASESSSEDNHFLYSTDDVSPVITWDSESEAFSLRIPYTATLIIPYKTMVYDIDLVTDGVPDRWLVGKLQIVEQA